MGTWLQARRVVRTTHGHTSEDRTVKGENSMAAASTGADVRSPTAAIRQLMDRVQAEYAEMPGLSVTVSQAQRLWAAERAACEEVFRRLTAKGVLRMTPRGRLVRC